VRGFLVGRGDFEARSRFRLQSVPGGFPAVPRESFIIRVPIGATWDARDGAARRYDRTVTGRPYRLLVFLLYRQQGHRDGNSFALVDVDVFCVRPVARGSGGYAIACPSRRKPERKFAAGVADIVARQALEVFALSLFVFGRDSDQLYSRS